MQYAVGITIVYTLVCAVGSKLPSLPCKAGP